MVFRFKKKKKSKSNIGVSYRGKRKAGLGRRVKEIKKSSLTCEIRKLGVSSEKHKICECLCGVVCVCVCEGICVYGQFIVNM